MGVEKGVLKIGVIGLGNMGGAIASGLVRQGYKNVSGYHPDPERCLDLCGKLKIRNAASLEDISLCHILVLAVKPYQMEALLAELALFLRKDHVLVSVAAGVTLALLAKWSKGACPVVRVMPNTPALVQRGCFALTYGEQKPEPGRCKSVEDMFSSIGRVYLLEEKRFDAFGALVGAGPAYVYAFMEALIDAGVDQGLPRDQATDMVSDLLDGSIALYRGSEKHVTLLKEMVTSPGGITIAGLNQFDKHGLRHAVIEAVAAAVRRSRELV